ncbi:MAG: hypothetical protein V1859_05645 [archaeon]
MTSQENFSAVFELSKELSVGDALSFLKSLSIFIGGIVIYSFFIFKFYWFIARKDIFVFDRSATKIGFFNSVFAGISYFLEYVFLFPAITFFAFSVLTIFLTFLSKNQQINTIALLSMAVVSAVRLTAYYNEELSRELAKLLPLTLLGVFLVDTSYFEVNNTLSLIKALPSLWNILIYYLVFSILLELILKIYYKFFGKEREEDECVDFLK